MVSYMAYLLEFAVLTQLQRWHFTSLANTTTPYTWFAAASAITIALASLSWYLYERPILRLKRIVSARPVERGEATLEPAGTAGAAISPGGR
jgi:peptidoglycan/LPS O-acetylase OafA/YrhL